MVFFNLYFCFLGLLMLIDNSYLSYNDRIHRIDVNYHFNFMSFIRSVFFHLKCVFRLFDYKFTIPVGSE